MKILHVVNISFVIPYYFGDQIKYFNKKKYKVHIVCSPAANLISLSNKFRFIPKEIKISRKINISSDIIAFFQLFFYIRKHKFNTVIGHTPKAALLSLMASFLNNVPNRIYFRHGLMYETSTGIKKFILLFIERLTSYLSTKVICVSQSVLNISITQKLSKPTKIILLNAGTCNGIETEFIFNRTKLDLNRIEELKTQLKVKKDDIIIGFVGRLAKDKGIKELIEAWEILKYNYKNIKLLLIGPIEERDSIENDLIFKIHNDNTIITIGFVEETNYYYSLMNIFILPSYREGFPTVVLEASSMELPIITTKATGCIDSILEGKTGLFCNINSISIARSIEYYINNENICKSHGINGRKFVIENFNQEKIWHKLEQLYSN
jgi:glycosyltransferase involved in cell wall biosynthesis